MTEYVSSWEWTSADHESSGIISPQGIEWQQTNPSGPQKDFEPIIKRLMHHLGFYPDLLACPACGSTKVELEVPAHKLHEKTLWICKPCNDKPNTLARFTIAIQSHLAKCYRCGGKGFMQFQCKKWCPACHGRGWLRV